MREHKADAEECVSKRKLIFSMFIFGTIGIFVRSIGLPSSVIAMARGFIGMMFLMIFVRVRGMKISLEAIRKNRVLLCLSGAFIGFNWILLFEAYRYTTVAAATLCYYLQPVFVMLASPLVLKERLSAKKTACVLVALAGMVLVSGNAQTGWSGGESWKGLLLGTGAALLYAGVILLNKQLREISAYDMTIVQLGMAGAVVLPYVWLTEDVSEMELTALCVGLLLVVGILHTGITYALYFGAVQRLKAQTVAIFSYIDPIVAILLSALLLRERLGICGVAGAVLILGATFVSELPE